MSTNNTGNSGEADIVVFIGYGSLINIYSHEENGEIHYSLVSQKPDSYVVDEN